MICQGAFSLGELNSHTDDDRNPVKNLAGGFSPDASASAEDRNNRD
ncbi:hypothetical protein [Oscillatoria sp. HE19RPO]|nr:hypothetical protein [Oscillatoria sp. HE19RPO]